MTIEIGDEFNRLTIVSEPYLEVFGTRRRSCVLCQCSCNGINIIEAKVTKLKNNRTKSCGCIALEVLLARSVKHGLYNHPIYKIYLGMKARCYNENCKEYQYYGEKKIIICQIWLESFNIFYNWSMKNGWKPGLTIDRIDNKGNYEPSNCRWTTIKVQNNNKSDNRLIEAFGETKTIAQWSEDVRCAVKYVTLRARITDRKWEAERAITEDAVDTITAFNETKTVRQWSKDPRCMVKYNTLKGRITTYGWDIERALTEPITKAPTKFAKT